jgi:MoxR-like ATPase
MEFHRFVQKDMDIRENRIEAAVSFLSDFLHGKQRALRLALMCLFSRGHLLIEDLPGLGKTILAVAISRVLGLSFGRIQCTSDLLPSDITGVSIFDKNSNTFEFKPGPIFNHVVLVDEINRATPKTQSALLEAMGEKQVTVEGRTFDLPNPFLVIATQNPAEQYGTFPLPESQLDRFMMKINVGYPERSAEKEILRGGSRRREIYSIEPFMNESEVLEIQGKVRSIHVSDFILEYLLNIIQATRDSGCLASGLSTRGALALINTSKANAYLAGKDFVIPENVKDVAEYVICHRVIFKEEYQTSNKREIIKSLLETVDVPA